MNTKKLNTILYDFEAVKSRITFRYMQHEDRRITVDNQLPERTEIILPGTSISMVWDIDLTDVFPETKVTVAVHYSPWGAKHIEA